MIRRYLLKVLIFVVIVCYFTLYQYKNTEEQDDRISVTHLSTLLLQEQKLFKQLELDSNTVISLELVEQHNTPYIEGKLLSLTQLTEHIVLAKFSISHVEGISLSNPTTIAVTYTGYINDTQAPSTNKLYRILIKAPDSSNEYYYIQGGLNGIIPITSL